MRTSAQMLLLINDSREAVRVAINRKGVAVSPSLPFRLYADKIMEIEGGATAQTFGMPINLRGPRYDLGGYIVNGISFNRLIETGRKLKFKPVALKRKIYLTKYEFKPILIMEEK